METFNHLFAEIYDYERLFRSFESAKKEIVYRGDVLEFTYNLEENLIVMQNDLIYHTLQPGPVKEFYINDPKKRLIVAPAFRDRVIHWSIYKTVYPIFSKGYTFDTYGSIEGKGAKAAVQRLMYWMRLLRNKHGEFWILKMDISKFFFRIPHVVIMDLLSRKVTDKEAQWLFDLYINTEKAYGMPLGATDIDECERLFDVGFAPGSLFAQTCANIMLDPADQFVKRELRQHHYLRYMDDMFVLSTDKSELHWVKDKMEEFLGNNLGLNLNKKTAIIPGYLGVEALGYIVKMDEIRMRKSTSKRMKAKLQANKEAYDGGTITYEHARSVYASYMGLLKICTNQTYKEQITNAYALSPPPPKPPEPDINIF